MAAKKHSKPAAPAAEDRNYNITVPGEAYNEAMVRLSEARSVLDVLGQLSDGDREGLAQHSLETVVLLAERFVEEAYELLLTEPGKAASTTAEVRHG